MRVKLIGVSDAARKSESIARAKQDKRRLIDALRRMYAKRFGGGAVITKC